MLLAVFERAFGTTDFFLTAVCALLLESLKLGGSFFNQLVESLLLKSDAGEVLLIGEIDVSD
jgi:hypothetical protein